MQELTFEPIVIFCAGSSPPLETWIAAQPRASSAAANSAVCAPSHPPSTQSLPETCTVTSRSAGKAARAAKDLEREAREDDIASLRVDPAEVKRMASHLMTDLSPTEAFGVLRIPVRAGWALIDGAGDGIELPHRRIVGADGRHAFVRIRREDVDAFAERFTTVVRIATAVDRSPRDVATMLRAERVPCCARRRHLGVDLILRNDLPPSLAA